MVLLYNKWIRYNLFKDIGMNKTVKIILIILSVVFALIIGAYFFICVLWSGTINFLQPKEIGTYSSPDGELSGLTLLK